MTSPSNVRLGEELGVSHAAVSRWKSGDRLPELDNMDTIARLLGWSMDEQMAARKNGTYADEFTQRVDAHYSVGTVGEAPTPSQ